jgi:hypothetical protein
MVVPVFVERRRDLETNAVRVEKVDAKDDAMIGRADDVEAVLLQLTVPFVRVGL